LLCTIVQPVVAMDTRAPIGDIARPRHDFVFNT
jgi:hypothetical protein